MSAEQRKTRIADRKSGSCTAPQLISAQQLLVLIFVNLADCLRQKRRRPFEFANCSLSRPGSGVTPLFANHPRLKTGELAAAPIGAPLTKVNKPTKMQMESRLHCRIARAMDRRDRSRHSSRRTRHQISHPYPPASAGPLVSFVTRNNAILSAWSYSCSATLNTGSIGVRHICTNS